MIKIVFTDIDGVWTDGGMYYDNVGNELKKYSTYDAMGVKILNQLGIEICAISGEDNEIIKRRLRKLNIKKYILGSKDKLKDAKEFCEKRGYNLYDAAYIGDDVNDIKLLKSVYISAAPKNAHNIVKRNVKYKLSKKGGDGAFREFVEKIILKKVKKKINIDEINGIFI
jgi:3-deoxy-D-manno-octulosonate 8-phosphate phosphatase (KDO 8-P phosphatase)